MRAYVSFRNEDGKVVLDGLFDPLPARGSVICGWEIRSYDAAVMDSNPPQMGGTVVAAEVFA